MHHYLPRTRTSPTRRSLLITLAISFCFFPFAAAQPDRANGNLIMFEDNGGWSWYMDERIVYDPAADALLFTNMSDGEGYQGSSRDSNVGIDTFYVSTARRTRVVQGNIVSYGGGDDHDVGAIWIRPDGRYLHLYAGHNHNPRIHYINRSTNPNDGATWQPQTTYNWVTIGNPDTGSGESITYTNLLDMSAEGTGQGRLYNIARDAQRSPNIAYSDDWGQTWTYGGKLSLTATGSSYSNGYFKFNSNHVDRIDFIATEHHPRDYNNGIYHGYIKGGKSYNSLGVVIDDDVFDEDAPAPEEFASVFLPSPQDGSNDQTEYHHAWTVELERRPDGNPVCLYSTRYGTQVADDESGDADHRLFYARFDGAQWHSTELSRMGRGLFGGEEDYTGLGAIHPNDPSVIFISTPIDPRDNTVYPHHEIFRGDTPDNGATWAWTQMTFESTYNNVRPVIPAWDAGHTAVVWLRGVMNRSQRYDQAKVGFIIQEELQTGPIVYIDADGGNTTFADGSPLVTSGPGNGNGIDDDRWHARMQFGNGGTAYSSNEGFVEDAPALKTTVSGLSPGTYDVFAFFWGSPSQDWRLAGGFSQSELLYHRRRGSQRSEPDQFQDAVLTDDGALGLYRMYLGRRQVAAGESIDVFIDDFNDSPSSGSGSQRSVYDGLGVALVSPAIEAAVPTVSYLNLE